MSGDTVVRSLMRQTGGTAGDRWFWSIACILLDHERRKNCACRYVPFRMRSAPGTLDEDRLNQGMPWRTFLCGNGGWQLPRPRWARRWTRATVIAEACGTLQPRRLQLL